MSFQKHLFNSTGIKFGFGIYLTESEASAVHYSQPRNQAFTKDHYLYTVEIPDLTDDNHLVSAKPVHPAIIQRTEAKLGKPVPQEKAQQGKGGRKWIDMTLTGSKKVGLETEKAAAEFLDSIGVFCNVWPQAQTKPDGLKNFAVFDANKVCIKKIEHIEVELKCGKYVLSIKANVFFADLAENYHGLNPLNPPNYGGVRKEYPMGDLRW